MHIAGVISFADAWNTIKGSYQTELNELTTGLENYLSGNVSLFSESDRPLHREYFEKSLYDLGWSLNDKIFYTESGRRVPIRFIGPVKNGVAAQISSPNPDFLTRWLFTHSTLAVRYGLAKVPILLVPMRDTSSEVERGVYSSRLNTFEYYSEQLQMLSPLSVSHPFLIIGYSNKSSLVAPDIIELPRSELIGHSESSPIIDRSIEFPPEYHQAGIGILNFFASYINEKYPDQKATVRIEQRGLNVRMVIESETGSREIIEKALHEYELIISGQERADKFTDNEKLILELRNELRVAKFRLESQQDIIALQHANQKRSDIQIQGLMSLLGQGLKSSKENHINVQVNPCIQNTVLVETNSDVSLAMGNIAELMESLPKESEILLALKDLEQSLMSIETEKNKENVRKSSAMSKFSRVIDQMNDGSSALKKAIDAAEQGYDIAKKLAGNYNKIAAWCGLPSIPTIFTS